MTARLPAFDLAIMLGTALCVGSALAAVAVNHLLRRPQDDVRRRIRTPIATASMLGFLVVVVGVVWSRLGELALPEPVRRGAMVLGLAIMAVGAAVNVAGRLNLGRDWADQVTEYGDQRLVQRGAYAVVRHPLYASITWMFLGAALVYRNLVVLGATLLVFVPAMVIRARQEERLLQERFPEYERYRRRVGMLFPRWPGHPGSP